MHSARLRFLIASLGLVAGLALIAVAWTEQRPALTGATGARAPASHSPTRAAAPHAAPTNGHAAPDLEALLPGKIDGTALTKGSTTGAVVFGSDAFSRHMARFLASVGKRPTDLRFANARSPSDTLDLETGVFQVRGVGASALRRAIISSTRPDAPGLTTSTATLSGKPVTMLVYPGGSILYLYNHGDLVFYVGTQDDALAARVLAMFP